MPRILDFAPMPDGRVGVVLDIPPSGDGSVTLWTETEREAALAAARRAERESCWDEINAYVKQGELLYPQHEERNGLVMACNIIRPPKPKE